MSCTIYHNPRCGKSRGALELLRQNGIEPEIVEYLKTVPSCEDIENLLSMLGLEPRELMRKGESVYKELNLNDPSLDRAALVQAMVDNPILLERPIVIADGRAVIGRPPERVLELVDA